jgi:hypothetical protein
MLGRWKYIQLNNQYLASSHLEVETACAKFKKYKLPDTDQILAKMIQKWGQKLLSAILKLMNSVWNKEELPDPWKGSIIVSIHINFDKTD